MRLDTGSCEAIQAQLYYYGFSALGMDPPSGCAKEGEQDDTKYPCPAPARKTPGEDRLRFSLTHINSPLSLQSG